MKKNKMQLIEAIKEAYKFSVENKYFGIALSKDGKTPDSLHMWNLRNFTEEEMINTIDRRFTYDLQNFGVTTTTVINWYGSNCMDDLTRMLSER